MDLYLDCGNGISGDMTLAALVHLGLDIAPLASALARAGVNCRIETWPETRVGGPGRRVDVSWDEVQPLRHPADIAAVFAVLDMGGAARQRALAVLEALTLAEAEAHQIPPEEVHFHEVGAIDTLVDIAGACWGLEQLGVRRVTASPLPWFSGMVQCAHGLIPLPAPAAAWLMRGKPVRPTDAREELVTPTGAALVHVLVDEFTDGPLGVLRALGTGYGSRPARGGLRAWLAEPCRTRGAAGNRCCNWRPIWTTSAARSWAWPSRPWPRRPKCWMCSGCPASARKTVPQACCACSAARRTRRA